MQDNTTNPLILAASTRSQSSEDAAPKLTPCYQCDTPVAWLAPDSRCSACTRVVPEEM